MTYRIEIIREQPDDYDHTVEVIKIDGIDADRGLSRQERDQLGDRVADAVDMDSQRHA